MVYVSGCFFLIRNGLWWQVNAHWQWIVFCSRSKVECLNLRWLSTRWAPYDRYKWSVNPYKQGYNPVTHLFSAIDSGPFSPNFFTGFWGLLCRWLAGSEVGEMIRHTVDGWNPAPVEVGSLSHYLQGFIYPNWCRISAINSIVHRIQRVMICKLQCL